MRRGKKYLKLSLTEEPQQSVHEMADQIRRYHASTSIGKQQLIEFEYKAKNQEESVIAIFRRFKRPMTPSEVWACLEYTEWPLTSVRRAMSNLQEAGKLEIMKKTKKGIYGRPEHYYKTRYMSRRKEIN